MKRFGVLLIFAMLVLSAGFLIADSTTAVDQQVPGLPAGVNVNQLQAANGQIINVSSNLGYLGQQWKNMLLSSRVFVVFDNFMHAINPVFLVLFAQDYAFSISFLTTIIVWIFFFSSFKRIFQTISIFQNKWVVFVISAGITIGAAQIGMIGGISNWLIWLVLGTDKPWWVQLIIALVIVLVIVGLYYFIRTFGLEIAKKMAENKEAKDREDLHLDAKIQNEITSEIGSAFRQKGREWMNSKSGKGKKP